MKIQLLRDALWEAAASVAGVVVKSPIPVLQNVLLDAGEDGVRLTATNLDITMRVEVAGEVQEPGRVTIPAKMLSDVAAKMPAGPVSLDGSKSGTIIRAGRSRFTLPVIDPAEFPSDLIDASEGQTWRMEAADLERLASIGFVASTEETRPILNGVCIFAEGGQLNAVATNGHQAINLRLSGPAPEIPDRNLIVPPAALRLAAKMFTDGANVKRTTRQLSFTSDQAELHVRLIEGPFPDVSRVMPTDFPHTLRCHRKSLLEAVGRVGIAAAQSMVNRARFELNGSLSLSAGNNTARAEEVTDVEHEGEDLTIGFNASYVSSLLAYLDSEEVEWRFSGATRPSVLGAPGDPSVSILLMPLNLKEEG